MKVIFKSLILLVMFWHTHLLAAPFTCDGTAYTVIGNPSRLQSLDSSTFLPIGDQSFTNAPANTVNGVSYNILDNFIYGYSGSTAGQRNIVRFDDTATVVNLGPPAGPGNFTPSTITGTMDSNGTFYGINGSFVYRVNVGTNPAANTLTYTRQARSGYTGTPADIAFSTADGNLYGMAGGRLRQINPTTGVGATITTTGDALAGAAGGAWSTADGSVYLYNNSAGRLFRVDTNAATPVVVELPRVTRNSTFDATACTPPSITKGTTTTQVNPGDNFTFNFVLSNSSATPIVVDIADTLQSEITFDPISAAAITPASPGGGTVSVSASQLNITGLTIPGSGSVSFTAQVLVDLGIAASVAITNQATMSFGVNTVVSDDPGSGPNGDPTRVDVVLPPPPVAVDDNDNFDSSEGAKIIDILANDLEADSAIDPERVSLIVPPGVTIVPGSLVTDLAGDIIGFEVQDEGSWSVNPTTGVVTFTPDFLALLDNDPTPVSYTMFDVDNPAGGDAGDESNVATITLGNALPVVLSHFSSLALGSGIRFRWGTASETFNFGFNLWGEIEGEWHRLNKAVIASKGADSLRAQNYSKRVRVSDLPGEVTSVGISSVEINGHEAFYGPFELGEKLGRKFIMQPIDWSVVTKEVTANFAAMGYVQSGRNFVKARRANRLAVASDLISNHSLSGSTVLAEFRVNEFGMVRVTHDALLAAGVDISGVASDELALTRNAKPIVRYVFAGGKTEQWHSGSYIDFYNAGVSDEESLHTMEAVFRLEYDSSRVSVSAAGYTDRLPQNPQAHYTARVERNKQLVYDFVMSKPDPWYERYLTLNPLNEGGASTIHDFDFDLPHALISDDAGDAMISTRVVTLTNFRPGQDHQLELVHINPQTGVESVIASAGSDVYETVVLQGAVAASQLAAGSNEFRVKQRLIAEDPQTGSLPTRWYGSSAYFDSAKIEFAANSSAQDNRFYAKNQNVLSNANDGYVVNGFDAQNIVAYAYSSGSLMRLGANSTESNSVWQATLPSLPQDNVTYWASTKNALIEPAVTVPDMNVKALSTAGHNYVIIAHPTFVNRIINPDSANGELDFLSVKEKQGYRLKVVDYEQVVQIYGHGHRTPDAIQNYLTSEKQNNPSLTYVLLVGYASRDPHDFSGNGSWNLIPTYYDQTYTYINYAPNDGKIADVDGDGFQDLAIGRWPARTGVDLETLISKTIKYTNGTASTQATTALNTAVLAADVTDGRYNFGEQMDQLERLLPIGYGTTKVYRDNGGRSVDLIDAINTGQTITSYSGHAGPAQWSYNGVLHYNDVDQLSNQNYPTVMLPLSCYTTYSVSEHTDTLGQRLMTSTGENQSDRGSAAIFGVASLSTFAENQSIIEDVVRSMLSGVDSDGDNIPDITLSLGEAVSYAKRQTNTPNSPVNVSGNLLGDPSIRIDSNHQALKVLKAY